VVSFTLPPLYPRGKYPHTRWVGGWVGPRARGGEYIYVHTFYYYFLLLMFSLITQWNINNKAEIILSSYPCTIYRIVLGGQLKSISTWYHWLWFWFCVAHLCVTGSHSSVPHASLFTFHFIELSTGVTTKEYVAISRVQLVVVISEDLLLIVLNQFFCFQVDVLLGCVYSAPQPSKTSTWIFTAVKTSYLGSRAYFELFSIRQIWHPLRVFCVSSLT